MEVTLETTAGELLEKFPDIVEVFEKHNVFVEDECDQVLDFPLEECETLCRIDDLDNLIADLNAYVQTKAAN